MTPFDFVNSASFTKEDLLKDDPEAVKFYVPYIVNKALSYFADTLLFANEINKNAHLQPKLQYHFFLNILRRARRFSKWAKPEQDDNLHLVQEYYQYNTRNAKQALLLLTPDQLKHIKSKIAARGERNDNIGKHG